MYAHEGMGSISDCHTALLEPQYSGSSVQRRRLDHVNIEKSLCVLIGLLFEIVAMMQTIKNPSSSPYSFRLWPDKVQALVTYDAMRLNDPGLPYMVKTGRYMPAGLHTPRLTVVAVKASIWDLFGDRHQCFLVERSSQ